MAGIVGRAPYIGDYKVTSIQGWRKTIKIDNNREVKEGMHNGVDLVGQTGGPNCNLYATCNGTVTVAIKNQGGYRANSYGNYVMIQEFDTNRVFLYGHMYSVAVDRGQTVAVGVFIGQQGKSGESSGEHCHYEVREYGKAIDITTVFGMPNTLGIYTSTLGTSLSLTGSVDPVHVPTRLDATVREVGFITSGNQPSINTSGVRLSVINYTALQQNLQLQQRLQEAQQSGVPWGNILAALT